jgi:hypothetical protein
MAPERSGTEFRAYRAGENLALEGVVEGVRTWEEFLAERVSAPVVRPVGRMA